MSRIETELFDNEDPTQRYLQECLALGSQFENPPQVVLELNSQTPPGRPDVGSRDIAISVSFQCYSPGVTNMIPRSPDDAKAQVVADSTLEAGHHTTRMHQSFTWKIIGASRSTIAEIFHSHPFYNSEQQSQRYAEAKRGNYLIPSGLSPEQRALYLEAADFANSAYFELLGALRPEVETRVHAMYPEHGWQIPQTKARLETKIDKCCQEVARYALPIAQMTTLDHTLNEIELLRIFRASRMGHYSDEARYIIASMINEVVGYDNTILRELPNPLPEEKPVAYDYVLTRELKDEIDAILDTEPSILWSTDINPRETLSLSARNVLGMPRSAKPDSELLKKLLDPAENPYLADTFETGIHHKLSLAMRSINLTFITRLSHTAESQRQRHRRTPGATPPIEATYDGAPDYITPLIIRENPDLKQKYDVIMAQIYNYVDSLIAQGVNRKDALLLLPNAHAIRVVESGDFFDWFHRWKQRLCFLAQEEIYFISVAQVNEVLTRIPEAKPALLAPCALAQAAGTGKCPEGSRWCGKPVWKWDIKRYKEERLI